ncbi:MAG: hypothetical protein AB1714_29855 [Acidobacteriota bacterium]
MIAVKAKYDGRVVIPDRTLDLPPDTEVVILVERELDARTDTISASIREYYLTETQEDRDEDEGWANSAERDAPYAWGAPRRTR